MLAITQRPGAIACGRKLLTVYHECEDTVQEGELTIALAQIYQSQSMYAEAKELHEKAITIMQKTGNIKRRNSRFWTPWNVFSSVGEYIKAK